MLNFEEDPVGKQDKYPIQRFVPLALVFPITIIFLLRSVGWKSALAYAGVVALALVVIFCLLKLKGVTRVRIEETRTRLDKEKSDKKTKEDLAKIRKAVSTGEDEVNL